VQKTINWNACGKISQVQEINGILVQYRYDAHGQSICKGFSRDKGNYLIY
jgi:YD repeat-containing protein